uniref:hypothetical protein n=1 Tax=Halocatena halophila TaxID=2814576 RepID=UPI002ED08676
MKLIAFSKLRNEYPNASVELEAEVDNRRADILVSFPESRYPLGHGIAVEVQHRNKSKKLFQTDRHYYDFGYSVLWLTKDDYTGFDVDLDNTNSVWPKSMPNLKSMSDCLSWPIDLVESDQAVEVEIPFPGEMVRTYEQEIRTAFEQGKEQYDIVTGEKSVQPAITQSPADESIEDSTSWKPIEHLWLSESYHQSVRALQYIESPSNVRYLKLSKGIRGDSPEYVIVPVSTQNADILSEINTLLDTMSHHDSTDGEWEEIGVSWLSLRRHPLTLWLRLLSTPWNEWAFNLGKKEHHSGTRKKVTASFSLDDVGIGEIRSFFEAIEEFT